MSDPELCNAARHASNEPVRAESGALLCRACTEGIGRDTLDLEGLREELLADQAWRSPGDAPIVSGSREMPLPIDPRRAAMRFEIESVIEAWAWWVGVTRNLCMPSPGSFNSAVRIMVDHAGWIAGQGCAVQCADEFRMLVGQARRISDPSGTVKTPAGTCPLCGNQAIGIIRSAEDVRESAIVCRANADHRWAPQEWSLVLGCDRSRPASVDTVAAAALLRIDEAALRKRVGRGQIERNGKGEFALADLQRLYGEMWGVAA